MLKNRLGIGNFISTVIRKEELQYGFSSPARWDRIDNSHMQDAENFNLDEYNLKCKGNHKVLDVIDFYREVMLSLAHFLSLRQHSNTIVTHPDILSFIFNDERTLNSSRGASNREKENAENLYNLWSEDVGEILATLAWINHMKHHAGTLWSRYGQVGWSLVNAVSELGIDGVFGENSLDELRQFINAERWHRRINDVIDASLGIPSAKERFEEKEGDTKNRNSSMWNSRSKSSIGHQYQYHYDKGD